MKTTELIEKLQEIVKEHGNLPVFIHGDAEEAKEVTYEVDYLSEVKFEWISIST